MITYASKPIQPTLWVQPLDEAGCWLRLATGTEGRIRLRTGTGIHNVVTAYRTYVTGASRGIVITVPAYNNLFQYAIRRNVTFEVDGQDNDGGKWTVLLSGTGRELHPTSDIGIDDGLPDNLLRRHLYIPGTRLAGSVGHPCS